MIAILVFAIILDLATPNYRTQTWNFLLIFPELWFDALQSLALTFGLNGKDLATIATADLIVVIATAIMNFLIFRHLTGADSRTPAAKLRVYYGLSIFVG